MNVTSILGSHFPHSRVAAMLHFAQSQLRPVARRIDELVLRDLPAQSMLQARFGDPALQQALRSVARSDVVLIATPICKAACSGLLKAFLDLLPNDGLRGKTVLSLASGAAEHLHAIDHALRPVLAALGVREVLEPVIASDAQIIEIDCGGYQLDAQTRWRIERSMRGLIERAMPQRSAAEANAACEADAVLARICAHHGDARAVIR